MSLAISALTERLAKKLVTWPRRRKRALMIAADLVCVPIALWAAAALRQGGLPEGFAATPWPYLVVIFTSIPIFAGLGLYRSVVRFIGPMAIVVIVSGVTASASVLALDAIVFGRDGLPVATIGIYWALAMVYVAGSRNVAQVLMNVHQAGANRVVIYGAGSAGAQVASTLRTGGRFDPVAFVDDDPSLHGSLVAGIKVFAPSELGRLLETGAVKTLVLALPSLSLRRRQALLESLESLSVRVMTVPNLADLMAGRASVDDIRDVDANDLLGRDPVPPDERLFDACIRGKSVMVTGAGGSIGSELCRQIARRGPSRLVLFEMSELALYTIESELLAEMKREGLEIKLDALLGNSHHKYRIREIMQAYGVQTVYHAAAYKHVPIVEKNLVEGVHNNVYGTWYAAEAALETGVETFVLISTDKAVNPTNVMGATKRLAEIVVQALQSETKRTRFCMVRFGNVLGSSGSVVPLFQEQIRAGGPVTVTHPDVCRYFMTTSEAAQLVLQAGSMGKGADVFVLDMGKPVRIDDLARRMITLMGLTVRDDANPEGDIEIRYTGLRPAEKLYEELLIGRNVTGTGHPMIMRAVEHALAWPEVKALLSELTISLNRFDCEGVLAVLERGVREYKKAPTIHDLVWSRRPAALAADSERVTVLADHRAMKTPPASS